MKRAFKNKWNGMMKPLINMLVFFSLFTSLQAASSKTQALAQRIDKLVESKLKEREQRPNRELIDDVFLRRIYLDVAGRIPTLKEVQKFQNSESPDKRSKLIEQLLNSEAYTSHSFNYWA
ncbi:MAG: DUF1549 domain-containing protein, partial [Lentisphaeraceae bacterium]|nr:DUF1549 domain-containing protein [Lentisphaeraceae bacterium]